MDRVVKNEHLSINVMGSCENGLLTKPNLVPKTLYDGFPVYYVYSDEYSIELLVQPGFDIVDEIVYEHLEKKYKHKTEVDIYEEIAKRDPYPTLEEVIAEVNPIAENDQCFLKLFEEGKESFLRQLGKAGDNPYKLRMAKSRIRFNAECFYEKCPLYKK